MQAVRGVADYRNWQVDAIAVMRNHVHVVVGVPGDPDPATMLRDFKSYAARALSARWPRPASGTWWTRSGSRRVLPSDAAIHAAIDYVRDQHGAIAVFAAGEPHDDLGEPRA
jgi:REP element-mobilizing transposase RayT